MSDKHFKTRSEKKWYELSCDLAQIIKDQQAKIDKLEVENKKLRNCIEKAYGETLSQTYEYTEYGRMLDAVTTLEKCLKELEE